MSDTTKIEGVLLRPNVESYGRSGEEKVYTEEVVRNAVETAIGVTITKQPGSMNAEDVVGEVTDAWYDPDRGLVYEAEIDDDHSSDLIENRIASVAPRTIESPIEECDTIDDTVFPKDVEIRDTFCTPSPTDAVGTTQIKQSRRTLSEHLGPGQ